MKRKIIMTLFIIICSLLYSSQVIAQVYPSLDYTYINPVVIDMTQLLPFGINEPVIGPGFEPKIIVDNLDLLKSVEVQEVSGQINLETNNPRLNLSHAFLNLTNQEIQTKVNLPTLSTQILTLSPKGTGSINWSAPLQVQSIGQYSKTAQVAPQLLMDGKLFMKPIDAFSLRIILPLEAKKLVKSNKSLIPKDKIDGRLSYEWAGEDTYMTSLFVWWTTSPIDLTMAKELEADQTYKTVTVTLTIKNEGSITATGVLLEENFPSQSFEGISNESVGTFSLYKGEVNDQRLFWRYNLPSLAPGQEMEVKYKLRMLYDMSVIRLHETYASKNNEVIAITTPKVEPAGSAPPPPSSILYTLPTQFFYTADTTAPTLNCPEDMTVTATGLMTRVEYSATATDNSDPDPEITYDPLPGDKFPIGTTEVKVTAADNDENISQCTFKVTVEAPTPGGGLDTISPVLACPENITVAATGPRTAVEFQATAIDNMDEDPTISYNYPPGFEFLPGTTQVIITATDDGGNTSQCTFQVTVTQPGNTFLAYIRAIGQEIDVEDAIQESEVSFGVAESVQKAPAQTPIGPYSVFMRIVDMSKVNTYYSQDIRRIGRTTQKWLLNLQIGPNADSEKSGYFPLLDWDSEKFPSEGDFQLWSCNSSGDLVSCLVVDMRTSLTYQTTSQDEQYFAVLFWSKGTANVTVNMSLSEGWSMVSLPVLTDSLVLSDIFPEAVVVYGYEKNFGYQLVKQEQTLKIGEGYWLLLDKAQNYNLRGRSIQEYTSPVENGWYMIGGCSSGAWASLDTGNIKVIYRFVPESGYQRVQESEDIEPCKGYWILFENVTEQAELKVGKK